MTKLLQALETAREKGREVHFQTADKGRKARANSGRRSGANARSSRREEKQKKASKRRAKGKERSTASSGADEEGRGGNDMTADGPYKWKGSSTTTRDDEQLFYRKRGYIDGKAEERGVNLSGPREKKRKKGQACVVRVIVDKRRVVEKNRRHSRKGN